MALNVANSSPTGGCSADFAKIRNCLRCRKSFDSQWSGERICKKCKSTRSWRDGLAPSFERRGAR